MTTPVGDAFPQSFSTADLPEDKRVELWESHNDSALFDLRIRTLDGEPLRASMVNLDLAQVQLARVTGNPHVVERNADVVRRHPSDAIAVYLTLMGEAFFYHDDAVRTVQPGQLLICDTDRPFMRGFSHGLEELVVKLPRPVFRDLTGLSSVQTPVVMDFARGSLDARTLARLVGRGVRADSPQPVDEAAVTQLVAKLITGQPGDLGLVHLATAKAFIDEHLTDPNLTAARIAEGIGLSERHLSRVFSQSGSSVPQHILTRRLDRAHALLAQDPQMSVAEVAAACGFGSATYFSHAFRDRFGERATDVRRRVKVARSF